MIIFKKICLFTKENNLKENNLDKFFQITLNIRELKNKDQWNIDLGKKNNYNYILKE